MSLIDYEEEEEREIEQEELREEYTIFEAETPQNLGRSYILSVTYSGKHKKALVKLYEPVQQKIYYWYDSFGHKPYFYVSAPVEYIKNNPKIALHPGFLSYEKVKIYDPLNDQNLELIKIIAKDPLAVGGGKNSLREYFDKKWEANIKYHSCYIHDLGLIPGAPYKIVDGKLVEDFDEVSMGDLEKKYGNDPVYFEEIKNWVRILNQPIPSIKHVAIDIEVEMEGPNIMPSPKKANMPVIAAACVGSDGLKKVFVLRRNVPLGKKPEELKDVDIEICESEVELFNKLFKIISSYPIVFTFNGDNFDLNYLYHRAKDHLRFSKEKIPISLGREIATVIPGIHVDLYKFFHNKVIQVYAFSRKYDETDLNSIAKALLGIEKNILEDFINRVPLYELAAYCYKDAWITYQLVNFNSQLVLKLIIILMRITKLPMEDVTRIGVSNWIKNMVNFKLRQLKELIPNKEDIATLKGNISTTAIIKGKKYLGAKVIEPIPGIHFDITVVDFASLYPSIIKIWNISFETIDCPHKECSLEKLPGVSHWVCKKRRGILSLLIGSLRDLRVEWYKPKSKDPKLDPATRFQYEVIQSSMKVILNAAYGVLGAETSDLYTPAAAESITAIGRFSIDQTIALAKKLNLEIIYGDTDSLFIKNATKDALSKLVNEVESILKVDIDIDKTYKYVVFSQRKKNYFGVTYDGNVDIKGLLGKKRHIPEFVKKTFYEIVNILKNVNKIEEFETAKEQIKKIVQANYLRLKSGYVSLSELVIRVTMNKNIEDYTKTTPQHVKAAIQLRNFGFEVKAGQTVSYVKVRGEDGVKAVQLARLDEIDFNKYVEIMRSTLEQLLEPAGIDFEGIVGISSLGKYF
jgi:DNA polymerase I